MECHLTKLSFLNIHSFNLGVAFKQRSIKKYRTVTVPPPKKKTFRDLEKRWFLPLV